MCIYFDICILSALLSGNGGVHPSAAPAASWNFLRCELLATTQTLVLLRQHRCLQPCPKTSGDQVTVFWELRRIGPRLGPTISAPVWGWLQDEFVTLISRPVPIWFREPQFVGPPGVYPGVGHCWTTEARLASISRLRGPFGSSQAWIIWEARLAASAWAVSCWFEFRSWHIFRWVVDGERVVC